jgi:hypothetical protein
VTSMRSKLTPLAMSLPFGARPSNSSDIVLELGAVAKIAFVRPGFGNASLGSPLYDVLSRSEFLCDCQGLLEIVERRLPLRYHDHDMWV